MRACSCPVCVCVCAYVCVACVVCVRHVKYGVEENEGWSVSVSLISTRTCCQRERFTGLETMAVRHVHVPVLCALSVLRVRA
jgi:hypothetical protein